MEPSSGQDECSTWNVWKSRASVPHGAFCLVGEVFHVEHYTKSQEVFHVETLSPMDGDRTATGEGGSNGNREGGSEGNGEGGIWATMGNT